MKKWLLTGALVLAGCGGGGPTAQDAEEHVRSQLEATEGVEVREVVCEEIDGGRFECSVDRVLPGYGAAGREQSRVIVDADEID
jgi:hypothetical protein